MRCIKFFVAIVSLFVLTSNPLSLFSQCAQTGLGIPIIDLPTGLPVGGPAIPTHVYFNLTGAANDTLGAGNNLEQVCIKITHIYVGDLDIFLTAPDGTTIVLYADGNNLFNGGSQAGGQPSGNDQDGMDLCFTLPGASAEGPFGAADPTSACDPSATAYQDPCNNIPTPPCYSTTWEPWSQTCDGIGLDAFNNGTGWINGCWKLTIHDNNENDTGTLDEVSFDFTDDSGISCSVTQTCGASLGTTSLTMTGQGTNNYILCANDTLNISSSGYCLPPAGCYGCEPELIYEIYVNGSPTGQFFSEQTFNTNPVNVNDGGSSSTLSAMESPGSGNQWCFVPRIFDDGISDGNGTTVQDTDGDACFQNGSPICFTYLNPITITGTEDCTTGEATLTISGGYPEFFAGNYNIMGSGGGSLSSGSLSTSGGTVTISGLSAGDMYSIGVVDDNGCTAMFNGGPFVSGDTLILTAQSNIACKDSCNGLITVSGSGGNSPWNYLWDSGAGNATTQTVTGLCDGSYSVTLTDNSSCIDVMTVVITEPASVVSASFNIINEACGNDASVVATGSGGVPGYSYNWDFGSTDSSAASLTAGDYVLTTTDDSGCVSIDTASISGPSSFISSSLSGTNPGCALDSTGSISSSTSGGSTPYSYLWNQGSTTADLTGIPTGNYLVTITDGSGCVVLDSLTLTSSSALTLSVTSASENCLGDSGATATAGLTGGSTPYSFLWSDPIGQTSATASGLTSETYFVTASDVNGCSMVDSVIITATTSLIFNASNVDAMCGSDGSISLNPSGGSIPYGYLWNTTDTTSAISQITQGTYSVTVSESGGCQFDTTIILSGASILTHSITSTPSSCASADGTATVSVSGGTSPYGFTWSDSGSQTNATATGLSSGTYYVTIVDASTCTSFDTVIVSDPGASIVSNIISTNIPCANDSTGTSGVSPTGGTSPYTFLWSTGETTNSVDSLGFGTVYVTITDSNGCSGIDSAMINSNSPMAVTFTVVDETCTGDSSGSLSATVSGGSTPYFYQWNDSFSQTNSTATGLTAGNYTLTVTDNSGCSEIINSSVNTGISISISGAINNATCVNNGSITAIISGGTSPYSFLWNNGNTTSSISQLTQGTYSVTASESNGCISDTAFTITGASALLLNITTIDSDCDTSTGVAIAGVSGGTSPYFYAWNDSFNQSTGTATGLVTGTYVVTVNDANGCEKIDTALINDPSGLINYSLTQSDLLCFGDADGTAAIAISGGSNGFQFIWSNSDTTASVSGLAAGIYGITATDSANCAIQDSVNILEPQILDIQFFQNNETCSGQLNGDATANVTGGTTPYSSYLWSTGATTSSINGLTAGVYSVTVQDASGCIRNDSVSISVVGNLNVTGTYTDEICGSDGTIITSVITGTSPYQYIWNSGQTTSSLTGLSTGSFMVTITDTDGCIDTISFFIGASIPMSLSSSSTATQCTDNNGTALVSVAGGVVPLSFVWTSGALDSIATGLASGSYSVSVTDAGGCTQIVSVVVPQGSLVLADFTYSQTSQQAPSLVEFENISSGATNAIWDFGDGGDSDSWEEDHTYETQGTYDVLLIVSDSTSCQDSATARIVVVEGVFEVDIPNTITPNSDGANDIWIITNIDHYTKAKVEIYNRNGHIVYTGQGYNNTTVFWDGNFNGNPLPASTYFYIVDLGEDDPAIKGTVTIIREGN